MMLSNRHLNNVRGTIYIYICDNIKKKKVRKSSAIEPPLFCVRMSRSQRFNYIKLQNEYAFIKFGAIVLLIRPSLSSLLQDTLFSFSEYYDICMSPLCYSNKG